MNLTGSIVFALAGSIALSVAAGTALGTFLAEPEILVVVLVAAVPLAIVSILLFALASLRPVRRTATARMATTLAILLALVAFGLAAANLGAEGTMASATRGTKVIFVLLVSCLTVVLVQWLIFRRDPPPGHVPPMKFGREGANRNA